MTNPAPLEQVFIEIEGARTVDPGKPTMPWQLFLRRLGRAALTPDGTDLSPSKDVQTNADSFLVSIDNTGTVNNVMSNSPTMSGTVTIDQGTDDGILFQLASDDVAHGMTDIAPTDVYGAFKKEHADRGGLEMTGLADSPSSHAVQINGYKEAPAPT